MKNTLFVGTLAFAAVAVYVTATPAQALSCIPVDMYLKDIVGKEGEVTILVGTVEDQTTKNTFTSEVLDVKAVKQGYAPNTLYVYHEKSVDWGYLCNAGPAKEGDTSVYIIARDTYGKPMVTQRLAMNDPLVVTLEADLKGKKITGTIEETTKTDRMNQIMTTVSDLFKEIQTLFSEYLYWKSN